MPDLMNPLARLARACRQATHRSLEHRAACIDEGQDPLFPLTLPVLALPHPHTAACYHRWQRTPRPRPGDPLATCEHGYWQDPATIPVAIPTQGDQPR